MRGATSPMPKLAIRVYAYRSLRETPCEQTLSDMSKRIRVLPLALLLALLVGLLAVAQTPVPQSVPNGLPSWAYNIPDKVQPPSAEVTGPVHLPGSTKEYDAAKTASNANPPDWFPDEHGPRLGS